MSRADKPNYRDFSNTSEYQAVTNLAAQRGNFGSDESTWSKLFKGIASIVTIPFTASAAIYTGALAAAATFVDVLGYEVMTKKFGADKEYKNSFTQWLREVTTSGFEGVCGCMLYAPREVGNSAYACFYNTAQGELTLLQLKSPSPDMKPVQSLLLGSAPQQGMQQGG